MGRVEQAAYHQMAQEVCDIFEGKNRQWLHRWEDSMKEAAAAMRYEEAARYRDRIVALKSVQERQNIVAAAGNLDMIGVARTADKVGVVILLVRAGKVIGKENYMVSGSYGESDAEVLAGFIKNYYTGSADRVPKEVAVPFLPADAELLGEWLTAERGSQVKIAVPQRGFRRGLKDMAQDNAAKYLADKELQWQHTVDKQSGAVRDLAEILDLPNLPERIECFDISHIQGAETVASMSVLIDGKPTGSEYRKFKLKTVQGKPDDFASMREIMARRYGNHPDWPLPDLIVIDGGKGQLHAALPVIRECGVQTPVIALAERIEEIFTEYSNEPIVLDHRLPALQLLQTVRDEAHRFAITYHRKLRSKRNFQSILDHIDGIGPKRRQALWQAFPNLDAMRAADVEALAAVPGMNRKAAEAVHAFLRAEKHEKQQQLQTKEDNQKWV